MDAQFKFFGSQKIAENCQPIMAGLNYFLTHEARGGTSKKLLGEKRDVKAWLAWLERRAHGEVDMIDTPIGYLPMYDDLKVLFKKIIAKDYPVHLYEKQFSLYIENILSRVELQIDAYRKEQNIPERLFEILEEQRLGLLEWQKKYGPIVTPTDMLKENATV
jgi:phosphoenolpyruvate carboxykinase (GTP)